jgi:acyl-CoA synthetase (AMP-forming)/AMP-acid ligase II
MVSSGRAISHTKIRVLDTNGNPVPDRRLGEVAIQSDCLLRGYYNRPDLTEKAFLDGWYLTGDLGYLAEGELYVTGRKKELIIVGGKNIYPQDLERLAEEVPGVHPGRVVAFGVFNETTGTEDVVLLGEADTDDEQERLHIADQVRYQVTRSSDIALRYVEIVSRGWLLKTSSGKIARSANRDKYLHEIQLPHSEHNL